MYSKIRLIEEFEQALGEILEEEYVDPEVKAITEELEDFFDEDEEFLLQEESNVSMKRMIDELAKELDEDDEEDFDGDGEDDIDPDELDDMFLGLDDDDEIVDLADEEEIDEAEEKIVAKLGEDFELTEGAKDLLDKVKKWVKEKKELLKRKVKEFREELDRRIRRYKEKREFKKFLDREVASVMDIYSDVIDDCDEAIRLAAKGDRAALSVCDRISAGIDKFEKATDKAVKALKTEVDKKWDKLVDDEERAVRKTEDFEFDIESLELEEDFEFDFDDDIELEEDFEFDFDDLFE